MFPKPNPLFTREDLSSREALVNFRVLQAVVLVSLAGSLGTVAATYVFDISPVSRAIVTGLTILLTLSLILLRWRILMPARILAPLSLYATVTFLMVTGNGLHDISIAAYGGVIIVASLALGSRAAIVSAGLIITAVFAIGLAEMNGSLISDASSLTSIESPFLVALVIISITFTQIVLINRMNASVQDAKENTQAQFEANRELTEIKNSLEGRVQTRTAELGQANELNARRAVLFESIARVAASATSLGEPSVLVPSLAEQISHIFGYDRVDIYLLETGGQTPQFAVFNRNGDDTASLLQDTTLDIDTLVGIVAKNGLSRTAFNEGADSVYFSSPELTLLQSEIALPLIAGANLIGVLAVYSKNTRAFSSEDTSTLKILSDIISNALEGSKRYLIGRQSVAESESKYADILGLEWGRYKKEEELSGFRFAAGLTEAITPAMMQGEKARSFDIPQASPVDDTADSRVKLLAPVRLRGQELGTLEIYMPQGHTWSEDDIDIVETVAERLALSMENARLFQSSASRAERERVVSEIASKISGGVRVESILRTTAQELSQALSGAEVLIKLQSGNPQAGPQ
ncbi:MAG: GAF domain-containing protein [Anaerolineales bacterium]|nr:GAF domain-containing protein [Anaerolineales bacterium]